MGGACFELELELHCREPAIMEPRKLEEGIQRRALILDLYPSHWSFIL